MAGRRGKSGFTYLHLKHFSPMDVLFGVVVPIVTASLMEYPLVFGKGYSFYGNQEWGFYWTPLNMFSNVVYTWNYGPNLPNLLFFDFFNSALLLAGNYVANHLATLTMVAIPGITSYFAIIWSFSLFNRSTISAKENTVRKVASLAGSIFYTINWQSPALITPVVNNWFYSYAIMPILFYLMFKTFKQRKTLDVLSFGAISSFGIMTPTWIVFVPLAMIIYLTIDVLSSKRYLKTFKNDFLTIILLAGSALIFNAFMVIPTISAAYLDVGGIFSSFPRNSQVGVAIGSSYLKLIDVLMFGQPTFHSFGWSYQNWTFLNIFIPLTAVAALFLAPFKKRYVLFFFSLLLISLFLAKGVNPPFGQLYVYLVQYSPSLVVGITRDVEPWLMLSALAYSFLIAMLVFGSLNLPKPKELLTNLKKPLKEIEVTVLDGEKDSEIITRRFRIPNSTIVKLIAIAVVVTALFATLSTSESTLHSYTFVRYEPLSPPSPYFHAMRYFSNMSSNTTVMWMPNGGDFSWKDNYSYVLGPAGGNFYQNSVSSSVIHSYIYFNNTLELGKILAVLGVGYLVYDSSGNVSYNGHLMNSSYVRHFLSEQKDIKLVKRFGFLYIYKNEENVQALYAGHPALGDGLDSILNSTTLLPGSNIYVNSSSMYREIYNLGIMNYSRVVKPSHSMLSFALMNGQQAYVVYSKTKTPYFFNSSMEQFNYTVTGNDIKVYLNYTYPSIVRGYEPANGTFDTGFGMVVQEYPDNGNFSKILANGIFPKQLNHTHAGGEVVFTAPKISNSSLYFYFYLGSFNLGTPLYYLFSTINNSIKQAPLPISDVPTYSLINESGSYLLGPSYFMSNPPYVSNGSLIYNAFVFDPVEAFLGRNLISNSTTQNIEMSSIYVELRVDAENFTSYGDPIFLNRSTGNLNVSGSTPVEGTYDLNFDVYSGNVIFENTTMSVGEHNFSVSINKTIMFSITSMNSTLSISLYKPFNSSEVKYSFSHTNPISYALKYKSQTPILVVLPVSYSSGWSARVGNNFIRPLPLDGGIATGFVFPAGTHVALISFVLQEYLAIGSAITALSYIILVGLALWEFIFATNKRRFKFIHRMT
ncbi:MAG: hypothetical protein J9259_03010 [Thermoplasmata archaeon YP2-bin.285]|uniref:Uncharacterized protein n=1 Tax=Candidatus Sysuiplasma superficiale TaxID=2823368 RepID=A0A8J7YIQ8_9ARCH|nr:hypothetical protein [Candidatus Sysuiplasma superficiale]